MFISKPSETTLSEQRVGLFLSSIGGEEDRGWGTSILKWEHPPFSTVSEVKCHDIQS
jgi:hypothetical protein